MDGWMDVCMTEKCLIMLLKKSFPSLSTETKASHEHRKTQPLVGLKQHSSAFTQNTPSTKELHKYFLADYIAGSDIYTEITAESRRIYELHNR